MIALIPVIRMASRPTQPASVMSLYKSLLVYNRRIKLAFEHSSFKSHRSASTQTGIEDLHTSIVWDNYFTGQSSYFIDMVAIYLPLIPFYIYSKAWSEVGMTKKSRAGTYQLSKGLWRHSKQHSPPVAFPHVFIRALLSRMALMGIS